MEDRRRVQLDCTGSPDRTRQEFKDECDINILMKRWRRGGQIPPAPQGFNNYGDFTNVTSFFEATCQIREAEEAFNSLPARVRASFDNSPAVLIEALDADPTLDLDQLVKASTEPPPSSGSSPALEGEGGQNTTPTPDPGAGKQPVKPSGDGVTPTS